MEIDYTEVFKEIEAISAGLRFSIKHMPRYFIKPNRIYCRNRAVSKMYDKIVSTYSTYNEDIVDSFISSLNSYLGLIRHYKSYKIRKRFLQYNIKV